VCCCAQNKEEEEEEEDEEETVDSEATLPAEDVCHEGIHLREGPSQKPLLPLRPTQHLWRKSLSAKRFRGLLLPASPPRCTGWRRGPGSDVIQPPPPPPTDMFAVLPTRNPSSRSSAARSKAGPDGSRGALPRSGCRKTMARHLRET
jgi:hypothetical protein